MPLINKEPINDSIDLLHRFAVACVHMAWTTELHLYIACVYTFRCSALYSELKSCEPVCVCVWVGLSIARGWLQGNIRCHGDGELGVVDCLWYVLSKHLLA